MKVPFNYYLHDNANRYEFAEVVLDQIDPGLFPGGEDEFVERVRVTPFYEIEFNCLLDTETGEIEILGYKA